MKTNVRGLESWAVASFFIIIKKALNQTNMEGSVKSLIEAEEEARKIVDEA